MYFSSILVKCMRFVEGFLYRLFGIYLDFQCLRGIFEILIKVFKGKVFRDL